MIKTLNSGDANKILYREWKVDDPRAVFLLVHGLGAHSGRWEFFANYMTQYGFSIYGIELKGFGYTPQKKGHIDSLSVYEKDICIFGDILRREYPEKKIFLLGESMGALIVFLTGLKNRDKFDGLICMSPVFQSKLKFSLREYFKIAVAVILNSGKEFKMPFTKEMCTRDIGYQVVMDTHNAEHRIGTAKLLLEIVKGQLYCFMFKRKINSNILFLLAGKDKLVENKATKKIYQAIIKGNKDLIEYPEMYHALSIEIERNRVFRDIANWAEKIIR